MTSWASKSYAGTGEEQIRARSDRWKGLNEETQGLILPAVPDLFNLDPPALLAKEIEQLTWNRRPCLVGTEQHPSQRRLERPKTVLASMDVLAKVRRREAR